MTIDTVALEKGIRAAFNVAISRIPPHRFAPALQILPSSSASEKYGWLGAVPIMREWLGDKKSKSIGDFSYTIPNKDWEATLEVDRNEIEDDQMGIVLARIEMLALRAQQFLGKIGSDLLVNGTTDLAYDSAAFFSNRSTNDNLLAGTGTTLAQLEDDLATARSAMLRFTDSEGEPWEFEGDLIVCHPDLEIEFQKIAMSVGSTGDSHEGITNPWRGRFQVVADPRLTDTNDWYFLATRYPLKPLLWQERKPVMFVPLRTQGDSVSEAEFWRKKLYYSVERRGNGGYGFYEMAIKVTNA